MATFTPKEFDITQINGGNEFADGDGITPAAVNAPLESAAYMQGLVKTGNYPIVESDTQDTSTRVQFVNHIIDGVTYPRFKFINLASSSFVRYIKTFAVQGTPTNSANKLYFVMTFIRSTNTEMDTVADMNNEFQDMQDMMKRIVSFRGFYYDNSNNIVSRVEEVSYDNTNRKIMLLTFGNVGFTLGSALEFTSVDTGYPVFTNDYVI